ncbi:WAS/WASL-interacting protein family member 1-like [Grus americana]|uniref:WAS/WASL-interacting protein family member 1-like n=1 Tax=Grus americana TaxID=9117 RepID=UPI002407C405|nr:WAS/WASL-interacting protein family member 1-like [Grus americana]
MRRGAQVSGGGPTGAGGRGSHREGEGGGCRADVSAGRACRRRQLLASNQSRHRQQPGRRKEPGQSRPRCPRRPVPGAGGRGDCCSSGGSPARPSARPPGEEGAAPTSRFARGPPSCSRHGCKNMTASSRNGMPWEGLGRLHLSKERSQ